MRFEKGHKKKGGRKKGTPNKVSRNAKELVNRVLVELDKTIIDDIDCISSASRVKLWLALQAYVVPKPKAVPPPPEPLPDFNIVLVDADGKETPWEERKKQKRAEIERAKAEDPD